MRKKVPAVTVDGLQLEVARLQALGKRLQDEPLNVADLTAALRVIQEEASIMHFWEGKEGFLFAELLARCIIKVVENGHPRLKKILPYLRATLPWSYFLEARLKRLEAGRGKLQQQE